MCKKFLGECESWFHFHIDFNCFYKYNFYRVVNYAKIFTLLNFKNAFWQAIVTSIYFLTIWFPIAMFIIFKIVFTKKTMDWGKTQHGVATIGVEELQ